MKKLLISCAALSLASCGDDSASNSASAQVNNAAPAATPADEVDAAFEEPACNDTEVVEFVIDAFNAAQDFETRSGVSLTALTEIREIGATKLKDGEWRQIRACGSRAILSSGATIAGWHQIRLPRVEDSIGYRVKLCFERYDPVSGGDCAAFDRKPE